MDELPARIPARLMARSVVETKNNDKVEKVKKHVYRNYGISPFGIILNV